MKKFYKIFLLIFFVSFSKKEFAQSKELKEPTKLFRIFEDEDFLNITGNGTDRAYTNGTRLDFFYEKKKESIFFLDRFMPKAGNSSKNVYGWSLMHIMVTPGNISVKEYQSGDYAYAGALFGFHSLYSFNPQKKYALQTEVIAGVRGPGSLAKELQTGFHSLISYQKPMGWDNQLGTKPLLNLNFTVEKQFLSFGDFLEINGGARIKAGTLVDAVVLYPMVRIGKMSPYFDGYLNQFGAFKRNGKTVKRQYYFVFKPSQSFIAHHGLVQGKRENKSNDGAKFNIIQSNVRHRVSEIQFGAVVAQRNFSMSYTQSYTSEYRKGLYNHSVGNISLYFRW